MFGLIHRVLISIVFLLTYLLRFLGCFVHLNLELTYNEIMTQNSNLVSRSSSLLYLVLFLTATEQQSIEVIETWRSSLTNATNSRSI